MKSRRRRRSRRRREGMEKKKKSLELRQHEVVLNVLTAAEVIN